MTFAADLRYEVANDTTIAGKVSDRVWPIVDRGKTLPSIVYNISGGSEPSGFGGAALPKVWDVQLDFYTKDYADIPSIRDAVQTLFNRFRGTIGENDTTEVYRSYVLTVEETVNPDDDDILRLTFTITFNTD